jgi:hypothetical protein
MNPQELQKNIALYYSKLPREAQEVFAKMEWLETLKQISAKYNLNQEQQEALGTETTLVLLGIIHLEEYERILRKETTISQESLDKILTEIKSSVINSVLPQITRAFEKNNEVAEEKVPDLDGKLDERFKKLPQNIQKALEESDYQNSLYSIYKEHKLSIDQMGSLEASLIEIILGNISPERFEGDVKSNLRLTGDEASELVKAVNEKILKRVREKMVGQSKSPTAEINPVRDREGSQRPSVSNGINNEEMKVLDSAGIQIVGMPSAPTAPTPKPVTLPKPDLTIPELEAPARNADSIAPAGGPTIKDVAPVQPTKPSAPAPSILSQKFTDTFKMPPSKTSYDKGADPYRLAPEE